MRSPSPVSSNNLAPAFSGSRLSIAAAMAAVCLFTACCDASAGWLSGRRKAAKPAAEADAAQVKNAEGMKLFESGRYGEAAERFGDALTLAPGYNEAAFNLGLAKFMTGDDATACERLRQVVKNDPDFAEAKSYLGQAYSRRIEKLSAAGDDAGALRVIGEYAKQEFVGEDERERLSELASELLVRRVKKRGAQEGSSSGVKSSVPAGISTGAPGAAETAVPAPVPSQGDAGSEGEGASVKTDVGATVPPVAGKPPERPSGVISGVIGLIARDPKGKATYNELAAMVEAARGGISRADGDAIEKTLNTVVEDDPRNAAAQVALGKFYEASGNLDRAEYHYQMAALAEPENMRARSAAAGVREKRRTSEKIANLAFPGMREAVKESAPADAQPGSAQAPAAAAEDEPDGADDPSIAPDDDSKLLSEVIKKNTPEKISDLHKKIETSAASVEDVRRTACYYITKNDLKTAGKMIEVALRVDPSDPETNYLMAFVKIRLKKKDEALQFLFAINPETLMDARLLNDTGILMMRLKKTEHAVKFFEKGIEADPKYIENYLSLAVHYSRINDHENARKSFAALLEASPGNMKGQYFMALAARRAGEHEKFIEISRRMQSAAPDDPYSKKIRRQMGLAPSDRLIGYDDERTLVDTAGGYLRSGDLERARARAAEALRINPDSPAANRVMAEILAKKGDGTGRMVCLIRLYRLSPEPVLALELGRGFFTMGLRAVAKDHFLKYLAKNGHDTAAKLELAEKLRDNGAPLSARTICEAVIARARSAYERERAEALLSSIQDEGIDTSEAEFASISESAMASSIRLASELFAAEQYDAVRMVADQFAGKLDEAPAEFLDIYALSLLKTRRHARAADVYRRMIARDRSNPYPYRQIGLIYMKRNNFARAEEYFRQSLIYKPDDATAMMDLGDACYYQKKYEDAEVAYSEGQAAATNSMVREELRLKAERVRQIINQRRTGM